MNEDEEKYWDRFIRNLCDLNYIKPFRHLIHWILHNIKVLQEDVAKFGTYVTEEVFDKLKERVEKNEDDITDLYENKADKTDLEDLEGRVDDNEAAIDDLEDDLGDLTDNVSDIEQRVSKNEENITDLQNDKADKTDLQDYEEKTDTRLDDLEGCCEEVGEHLEQVDERLDTDEDNIDTLLDNMIVRSDHNGIIATDNYFADYLDVSLDDLVREMAEKGIMKYEIYTAYYPGQDANWVSAIHDAVQDIYGYTWENNFAFIEVDNILFGGTSPRVMVKLIPRERDVYICMCYHVGEITEAFDGHCFLHRTPTEELEERIEKCEERLDEHDEILETLQEADKVFEERIGKLEECCEVVNETLADYDKRITQAQTTADQADAKADHNADDISHLEDDIKDVRDHANKAVEEAGEAKDAAEQAEESAKNAEEKAEEAAEKVDQFDDRITKNEEDISNLEECCEEVQGTLEEQDSRIEANETAIDDLKENNDEISEELDRRIVRHFSSLSDMYAEYEAGEFPVNTVCYAQPTDEEFEASYEEGHAFTDEMYDHIMSCNYKSVIVFGDSETRTIWLVVGIADDNIGYLDVIYGGLAKNDNDVTCIMTGNHGTEFELSNTDGGGEPDAYIKEMNGGFTQDGDEEYGPFSKYISYTDQNNETRYVGIGDLANVKLSIKDGDSGYGIYLIRYYTQNCYEDDHSVQAINITDSEQYIGAIPNNEDIKELQSKIDEINESIETLESLNPIVDFVANDGYIYGSYANFEFKDGTKKGISFGRVSNIGMTSIEQDDSVQYNFSFEILNSGKEIGVSTSKIPLGSINVPKEKTYKIEGDSSNGVAVISSQVGDEDPETLGSIGGISKVSIEKSSDSTNANPKYNLITEGVVGDQVFTANQTPAINFTVPQGLDKANVNTFSSDWYGVAIVDFTADSSMLNGNDIIYINSSGEQVTIPSRTLSAHLTGTLQITPASNDSSVEHFVTGNLVNDVGDEFYIYWGAYSAFTAGNFEISLTHLHDYAAPIVAGGNVSGGLSGSYLDLNSIVVYRYL